MKIQNVRKTVVTLAVPMVAATMALGMASSAYASAAMTVRDGSGAAYSGNVQAKLLGTASVSTSVGSTTCDESILGGSVSSTGADFNFGSASFTANGGPCVASTGGGTKISGSQMPWTGGAITHAPVAGGKDGDVAIRGFAVKAEANVFGIDVTCFYKGDLTGGFFNAGNPNRPVATNNQAQMLVDNVELARAEGSQMFLCPVTAKVSGTYQVAGQSASGFDVPLTIGE